jgi:hypothetical protein
VLEFAPSTSEADLHLKLPNNHEEEAAKLTAAQRHALGKAHDLLGFHAGAEGHVGYLNRVDLGHAVQAFTDDKPTDALLDSLLQRFGKAKQGYMNLEEFTALLVSGLLHPQHEGRYYVALSLAEAETIRRILHIRKKKDPQHAIPNASTELALRYSPMTTPGLPVTSAGDGGVVFDASTKWHSSSGGTLATPFEAGVAHSSFRFFDCDMHFALPALNILVRSLHGRYTAIKTPHPRFFIGVHVEAYLLFCLLGLFDLCFLFFLLSVVPQYPRPRKILLFHRGLPSPHGTKGNNTTFLLILSLSLHTLYLFRLHRVPLSPRNLF